MPEGTEPKVTINANVGKPYWTDDTKTVLKQEFTKTFVYNDDISIIQQFQNDRRRLLHAQADALGGWLLLQSLSQGLDLTPEQKIEMEQNIKSWESQIIESFKGDTEHLKQFLNETKDGLEGLELKAQEYAKNVEEWTEFTEPPFDRLRLKRAEAIAKSKEGRTGGADKSWKQKKS